MTITKQITTSNYQNNKHEFDLERRTLGFAKEIVIFCKSLTFNTVNNKLIDQIIRSGSSVGANYREANDCLGKKDFIHRLRISRKESKETIFWLELILVANPDKKEIIGNLINECTQIRNILSSIINKVEYKSV